jgi:hypothetical protein
VAKRIAVLAVGLVLVGTAAWATIPDANGVIHGCYRTSGPPNSRGALRVIDIEAGQTCGSGEVALSWNQTGPQGPAGATGPAGPQGATGAEGLAGAIVQHLSFNESMPVSDPPTSRTVGTFMQGATELNLYFGKIVVSNTSPADLNSSWTIKVDGAVIGSTGFANGGGSTVFGLLPASGVLQFEPGVNTEHTVTVEARTGCQCGPTSATVNVKVDVMEAS